MAKEQIVGMVAAVDWFLSQTDEGMQAEFRKRADLIAAAVKDLPTMKSEIVVPPVANQVPHLLLRYDQDKIKISPLEVAEKLRHGTPSIELNPATGRTDGSAGLAIGCEHDCGGRVDAESRRGRYRGAAA